MKKYVIILAVATMSVLPAGAKKPATEASAPKKTVEFVQVPAPEVRELKTPVGIYRGDIKDGLPEGRGFLTINCSTNLADTELEAGYVVRGAWSKGVPVHGEILDPYGERVKKF